jgi:nitroreductase
MTMVASNIGKAVNTETVVREPLNSILDLARWAPSGDNTQPWRFEIIDDNRFAVYGFDTRRECVYDLDGHGSHLSLGALLETIAIAATAYGRDSDIQHRSSSPELAPVFDVVLRLTPAIPVNPLAASIQTRSVYRRPLSTRTLTAAEKRVLEAAVQPSFTVLWLEGWPEKWAAARLMFANAKLRLTMREAYEVHRRIIDWGKRFSEDKIPDQSFGLDPLTLRLMRWVMGSWGRVKFFNTFLAGTLSPRIQLDLIPSLACGAHFALLADRAPETVMDYVEAGRRVQRFWLTADQLQLQLQPEMTPLIFARYLREGRHFTQQQDTLAAAAPLAARLGKLLGPDLERAVFMARIGAGPRAESRSIRKPAQTLRRGATDEDEAA